MKRLSGVYVIYCKNTRRRYVGGSKRDIDNRWSHHVATLNNGEHHSKTLQRDWNKFGATAFTFRIVILCPSAQVQAEEQKLLDKPWPLYNQHPKSFSAAGFKMNAETRKRMSEIAKERNARPDHNALLRARAAKQHAEGKLGRQTWSADVSFKTNAKLAALAPQASKRTKAMWENPDIRNKIIVSRWTPEHRARQAERIRAFNESKRKK